MDLNKEIKISFGKKFELMRKNAGYSRAKLGADIGVSGKTIQSWETGRTFPENMSLIPIIENRLGFFIPSILGETVREEVKKAKINIPAIKIVDEAKEPEAKEDNKEESNSVRKVVEPETIIRKAVVLESPEEKESEITEV